MSDKRYAKRIDGRVTYWQFDHAEYTGPVSIRLATLDDDTANEHFNYNEKCSACWLGHAHSGNYHRAALAR